MASRAIMRSFGATSYAASPVPSPAVFPPPAATRLGRPAMAHYGVMIPDLPEPHRFLANMTLIGYSGFRAWDDDSVLQGTARQTATVCHGTAATTDDPFSAHGEDDCEFAADGSLLCFGDCFRISGLYPSYRVVSGRPGFGADLELTATGEITWFTKSPLYSHISLLTRYRGSITHEGTRTEVSGLCTYEYGAGFAPYMIAKRPLPKRLKLPIDYFTYHVLNLDADTQLLLVGLGAFRQQPALISGYLRTAGQGVRRLGTSARFEVLESQPEALVGHDGEAMAVPSRFRWIVRDGSMTLARLEGTVDTQWLYAGMGNIAGYRYEGEFQGRDIAGQGYLEYSDRRR
ncbi:hypothetical protein FB384_002474 [Prauserella sediminis]|uniref:Uncharacterized protein n=3 Tax=Prauserella salsuginis group TaxID=2893672 RepID=A0A839XJU4_9PSEU|nr:hypothetical protein [Prauserella sediminis]